VVPQSAMTHITHVGFGFIKPVMDRKVIVRFTAVFASRRFGVK
jgi:hypothetical protein